MPVRNLGFGERTPEGSRPRSQASGGGRGCPSVPAALPNHSEKRIFQAPPPRPPPRERNNNNNNDNVFHFRPPKPPTGGLRPLRGAFLEGSGRAGTNPPPENAIITPPGWWWWWWWWWWRWRSTIDSPGSLWTKSPLWLATFEIPPTPCAVLEKRACVARSLSNSDSRQTTCSGTESVTTTLQNRIGGNSETMLATLAIKTTPQQRGRHIGRREPR